MMVIVLTEYSPEIGFGHISRTLALSDRFAEIGWKIKYFIREAKSLDISLPYAYELVDWENYKLIEPILEKADVVIFDTYKVSPKVLDELARCAHHPLTIIDSKLNHPNSGVLVFGSVYADDFSINTDAKILSGKEYILFRQDFIDAKRDYVIQDKLQSVIISLGKFLHLSDLESILLAIKNALGTTTKISVVGSPITKISSSLENNCDFYFFLETSKYVDLLLNADLVICNGGQTLNECIALNIPSISIEIANNQMMNIMGWEKLGVTSSVGKMNDNCFVTSLEEQLIKMKDKNTRENYSNLSKKVIDFDGSKRVLKHILNEIRSY